ncbi:hypothetical protein PB2503_02007 [Parvularcula bermudensis HTCC2503]|uniref:DUF2948 family protein n=1 Tax=Parvularcula bermudensis (strain ATCC BAA-594 / HTCC2503 / KCTC 12087) TaxID=314260 RepID=E0TBY7_PARBH|nr:DUF2948 family protein [Parvularcula bermudensis]ADM08480.1 hypothetical protein PB2503_02007 [Parvularcula bermudensis HTCC2503]
MTRVSHTPLALMAADREDLEVVSSILQDAAGRLADTAYLPAERRFVWVANRFLWEEGVRRRRGPFHRVRTGLHIDDVVRVRTRGLPADRATGVLALLRVGYDGDENGGTVSLDFAGGGTVALDVEAINITLKDLSAPWRTKHKPNHEEG